MIWEPPRKPGCPGAKERICILCRLAGVQEWGLCRVKSETASGTFLAVSPSRNGPNP